MTRYKFKTRPYAHQLEGVRFAFSQFRKGLGAAFLFEPRTGKTKTTIDTLSALHLKHGVRKALVIAPNRVLGVWVREIPTHSPLNVQVIVWDAKARKQPIPAIQPGFDMQILVTNFETFSTQGRRLASGRRSKASGRFKHRDLIRRWLADEPTPACVVDEGHKLKSPSGAWSNMIVSMRPMFTYRLLLTGTPITKAKRAADAYMQWQWVNPRRFAKWGPTYEAFRDHTGVWTAKDNIPIWRRARPKGMRDLQAGLHADGMVVHRDECFDMPTRLPDRLVLVRPSRATAKHYDEMAAQMVTELENGDIAEASIPLVVTLRLSQITSGYVGVIEPHPTNPNKQISRPVRFGREKIDALKELLVEEVMERDEKVVICARFAPDLNAIERLCETLGIRHWSIRGGVKRMDSDAYVEAFKRWDDGPAAMIAQPSAGGTGIDLSTAGRMIWYSLIPSFVDFTQMCDRIALHHRGVEHTFLLMAGTVDGLLYETLLEDGDVTRAIMRKPQSLLRRGAAAR